jgi:AcrR family transcriptional regulator
METARRRHTRSTARRRQIVEAALSCFTELGFAETGMADICRKAGASVGSVYHHYAGKDRLAAAVYLEGIREYQEGILRSLADRRDARAGIRRVVGFHLGWVAANPRWARFLFHERHAEFMGDTADEFRELNRKFAAGVGGWLAHHVGEGTLKKMPWDVQISLMLGPCQEYSRLYLEGVCVTGRDEAARMISRSVWQSLAALR